MSASKSEQADHTHGSHGGEHGEHGNHVAHQPHAAQGSGPSGQGEQGWHGQLRARGYRLTPQRQLVLEAIAHLGHATPDQILAEVRETATGVNSSTVYRTLDLLEELALVTHTHLGHGSPTYHVANDAEHVHLVCRSCGGIAEVSPDVVAGTVERLAADHGFEADVHHFAVFGRCAACKSKA